MEINNLTAKPEKTPTLLSEPESILKYSDEVRARIAVVTFPRVLHHGQCS